MYACPNSNSRSEAPNPGVSLFILFSEVDPSPSEGVGGGA